MIFGYILWLNLTEIQTEFHSKVSGTERNQGGEFKKQFFRGQKIHTGVLAERLFVMHIALYFFSMKYIY